MALNQSTVVITSGQSSSPAVNLGQLGSRRDYSLGIGSPSAADASVFINVSNDDVTYFRLQSPPGTDVELAAGKAIGFTEFPWQYLKLALSTGTAGADRTFQITGIADAP
jgi:hypothetical protein